MFCPRRGNGIPLAKGHTGLAEMNLPFNHFRIPRLEAWGVSKVPCVLISFATLESLYKLNTEILSINFCL